MNAEVEITGKVISSKFEPVSYIDKKTGDKKDTQKGQLVLEYTKEWFDKQGNAKTSSANVAFDFFGTGAENASGVKIDDQVTIKGNASANYWEKGDKWFSTIKAFDLKTMADQDVPF